MKSSLLLFFCSCVALYAQYPPVLEYSNTKAEAKQHVLNRKNFTADFLQNMKAEGNQNWDFSVLKSGSGQITADYLTSTHVDFPNTIEVEFEESTTPNTVVDRKTYFSTDENGIHEIGTSFAKRAYSIMQFTGNVLDTFFLLEQQARYATPRTHIKFPCTMGSAWQSGYELDFNSQITLTAYLLNKAPFLRNTKFVQYDSVIGWGQMRVAATDGKPSIQYPTLMVARTVKIRHYYTLNGSPAPEQLLIPFGLVQNDTSASYSNIYFWRGGNQIPLARIIFNNPTFEINESTGIYTDSRDIEVDETSSVQDELSGIGSITPNPVMGSSVKVQLEKPFEGGEIALYNSLGIRLELPSFMMNGTHELTLDVQGLSSGTYSVQLRDNYGKTASSSFVVVK